MSKAKYTIFVVDDDPLVNQTIVGILQSRYEDVISYTEGNGVLEDVDSLRPDLILLDVFLGDSNGLDVLSSLREHGSDVPVVMITAFSDVKMAVRAVKLGAEDFITKPLDLEQLEMTVERALSNYEMRRQVEVLRERVEDENKEEFIGTSASIQEILTFAGLVAQGEDTTVLITGESGTGKEMMARYIHKKSPRRRGPFITVNCGAIPKELAENELFGYERGAFTGATEKVKQGKFELAHKGTILLDEVGELSPEMQVKLLRVLQEKTFYRLGGQKEVHTDVRVIAATNRDLPALIEEGKFREDLYYRLNVAPMVMPPLRERPEDIMIMASKFANEFAKKFSKTIKGFTPEACEVLQSYPWRGNVRELRNVVERVTLLSTKDLIYKEDLKFLTSVQKDGKTVHAPKRELQPGEHFLALSRQGATMEAVLKDLIEQTLELTGGNQVRAAKLLGITRAKLRYRLDQVETKKS